MNVRTCKRCSETFNVSNAQIKRLIDEQLSLETNLVNDDIYEERLEQCYQCQSLLSNVTCGHCGCYVQFRAKLAYKQCPFPEGAKW